jgi:hypothetical protein
MNYSPILFYPFLELFLNLLTFFLLLIGIEGELVFLASMDLPPVHASDAVS